jgi:hypothetical protein
VRQPARGRRFSREVTATGNDSAAHEKGRNIML